MMDSRWDLISNFKESHKLDQDLKFRKLFLKEPNRIHPFIVYEDNTGTHMYTSYSLFLLDKLNELHDNGIDTIRIDSFLHDENWLLENIKFYKEAMELANNNVKISKEFIENTKNELSNFDTLSHGFYMSSLEDLIYIPKKEYNAGYQTE
jgi:putative protease